MKIFEIFDLKNFGRSISKCSNFFHNKPFWSRFFSKLCRFSWRRRWHRNPCHLKRLNGRTKKMYSSEIYLSLAQGFPKYQEASSECCPCTPRSLLPRSMFATVPVVHPLRLDIVVLHHLHRHQIEVLRRLPHPGGCPGSEDTDTVR